jgi:poly(A) polymerase
VTRSLDLEGPKRLLGRPALARLLIALEAEGEETRIVGGAVRNALLRREVTEIDVATTALPKATMKRAAQAGLKAVPTGIAHGTVTVVVDGAPFEVTTLREDVETDGRHAVVQFGRDFAADARRRDFTINALSVSADGQLHDYAGGLADLAAGRVRFIGDARTRIREDFLRVLRFFRFHAEYGRGDLDPAGLQAAVRERAGLAGLSHERIRTELLRLLAAPRAVETLARLAEHGLLTLLLGGVAELGRFARVVASEGRQPDAVRRLAALAVLTVEDAERLRERLRLSNQEHGRLQAYGLLTAALKTRPLPVDAVAIRQLVAEHGTEPVVDAFRALAGEPRPVVKDEASATLRRFESGEEPVPVFPLRGADLVARGIERGPRVGELMAAARRAWLAQGCPTDEASARALLERTLELDASEAPAQA